MLNKEALEVVFFFFFSVQIPHTITIVPFSTRIFFLQGGNKSYFKPDSEIYKVPSEVPI